MTIGEKIKSRRKELGFSAEVIAEKLGVSPATIYRYESGDIRNIRSSLIVPLTRILRMDPTELF